MRLIVAQLELLLQFANILMNVLNKDGSIRMHCILDSRTKEERIEKGEYAEHLICRLRRCEEVAKGAGNVLLYFLQTFLIQLNGTRPSGSTFRSDVEEVRVGPKDKLIGLIHLRYESTVVLLLLQNYSEDAHHLFVLFAELNNGMDALLKQVQVEFKRDWLFVPSLGDFLQ